MSVVAFLATKADVAARSKAGDIFACYSACPGDPTKSTSIVKGKTVETDAMDILFLDIHLVI